MMQPTVQHRRGRSMSGVAKDRDEDLALFHEMQKRERERKSGIYSPSDVAGTPTNKLVNSTVHRMPMTTPTRAKGVDDLLTSDFDKNDYDWLLTPPATPLFTTLDPDVPGAGFAPKAVPLVRSLAALKTSRLANSRTEPVAKAQPSAKTESASKPVRGNVGLRQPNSVSSLSSSTTASNRRSSLAPSSNTASRPSTPSGRATIPSSTRSTTSSRSSTPLRRPTTPNLHSNPPVSASRSSSVSKANSVPSKSASSSRGSSPTTRARAWQPSAMPGFSSEPPPNLRTTMPERSTSNSRGASVGPRPGGPTAGRTTRDEAPDPNVRSRRQSCSPSVTRGRLTPDSISSDRSIQRNGKLHDSAANPSAPIVIGSKMVEKVMRARRSAALAQNDQCTPTALNSQVKRPVKPTPVTREPSGFGRNLSKKSLDMAIRHMDIRRSTPNGFRPFMSNVPASSLYSVRSGSSRGRTSATSTDSPMATSSNASSELSMSIVPDPEGSEQGDEVCSERGSKASPISQPGSVFALSKDWRVTNWIGSPDYRDDSVELMQLFRQGIERYSGSESPLVCQHGGASDCDRCKLGFR